MTLRQRPTAEELANVRAFARELHKALKKDAWGDIEPEIFSNVADGLENADPDPDEDHDDDGLLFNKLSREEAVDAAKGMLDALVLAFRGLATPR